MDIVATITAWAAPALFAAVIYLVNKKLESFKETDDRLRGKLDHNHSRLNEKLDAIENKVEVKFNKVSEELQRTSRLIVDIQSSMNKEIYELNKMNHEMKLHTTQTKQWLEESKTHFGKVIYLDEVSKRHEKIFISSAKVMRQHTDRLGKAEAEIVELKKKGQ